MEDQERLESSKSKIAKFVFTFFAVVVLLVSALTSFSFFFIYFSTLVPAGLIDSTISRIISGLIGMMMFDVATAIWLFTYLNLAETAEQRAISIGMTGITFIGASAASVAYLGLSAGGELALDAATKNTIGLGALLIVIIGIILNFGAAQAYQSYSLESKASIRAADRRNRIQQSRSRQEQLLDKLVTQQMEREIGKIAPGIATQQVEKIAQDFYRDESLKFPENVVIALEDGKSDTNPPKGKSNL